MKPLSRSTKNIVEKILILFRIDSIYVGLNTKIVEEFIRLVTTYLKRHLFIFINQTYVPTFRNDKMQLFALFELFDVFD